MINQESDPTSGAVAMIFERPDSIAANNSQALCLACGLCCTGNWFERANLYEDEIDATRALGLTVEMASDGPKFQLPCHLHVAGACSIYGSWRPHVCGAFTCGVIDAYVAGTLPFDEALRHVKTAKTMADNVRAEVGFATGGLIGDTSITQGAAAAARVQSLSPLARLDIGALQVHYVKFFKKNRVPVENADAQNVVTSESVSLEGRES